MRISELRLDSGSWNWQLIEGILWKIDHDELRRFPIQALSGNDRIIWHYNSNGVFSVRSAYFLALNDGIESSKSSSTGNERFFKKLWHLNIQNKIKIFVWKAIHAILPSRHHLASRGVQIDPLCPRCGLSNEHSFHVLWHCPWAKNVWSESALWPMLSRFRGHNFMELWCWTILNGSCDDVGCFAMISWSIWLARNQWVFEGRSMHGREVVSRAGDIWYQFLSSIPVSISSTNNEPHLTHWNAPQVGRFKINVDVAVFVDSNFFGVGMIVRDHKGMFLMARASCLEGVLTPYLAELLAVREGIILAHHLQWTDVIVETDACNVVESIRHPNVSAPEASIISFIRGLMQQTSGLTVTFCRRSANKAAHELASFGLKNLVAVDYKDCSPFYLSQFVRSDFIL